MQLIIIPTSWIISPTHLITSNSIGYTKSHEAVNDQLRMSKSHTAVKPYVTQIDISALRISCMAQLHRGWTPFYFMYDPRCSTTFPWCTINAPAAFAWCTINVPVAFTWCTNYFVHKVEFWYIGWNGVHPLWISAPWESSRRSSSRWGRNDNAW